ncbi:FUSC family protein [Ruegeria sp. HU-ET01832]|uniref:FUSC family protein n=1 Tax=Ruegeria sp. HU-ET01832 TaxID=3135906 RepID=UPI0033414EF4
MTMDSLRLKAAIKLALALVLAYWIALSMDWAKPYWAGLSIVACSLTTFGESFHKGLLRLGGTFLAIVVAIALLSLFPQDRWLFIAALSLWLAFCCFNMFRTSRSYFWMTAGFVVPILVIGGGENPVNDFTVVVLRAQQTVLGIVCFSVVYSLLWPYSSREQFEEEVRKALTLKRRLLMATLDILTGNERKEDLPKLRMQIAQLRSTVERLLDAAIVDSYDVWDRRLVWRQFVANMASLDRELQRLYLNARDLEDSRDTAQVQSLCSAILSTEQYLLEAEKILSATASQAGYHTENQITQEMVNSGLGHFQLAAMTATRHNVQRSLEYSRSLSDLMTNIKDASWKANTRHLASSQQPKPTSEFLDRDMWSALIRVQVIFLATVACVLFVPGFPNPALVICIGVSLALNLALHPQASVSVALPFAAILLLIVGTVHLVLLPLLATFWQLALLIFGTTVLVAYLTSRPEQMIVRSFFLNLFLVGLQIDNQQQYSFLFFATMFIGLFCVIVIIECTRFFPVSLRPEIRVEALIKRFFSSADYVVRHSLTDQREQPNWFNRMRLSLHVSEIDSIPTKLVPWLSALSEPALGNTKRTDTLQIATSLEALSSKLIEFAATRRLSQAASLREGGGEAMKQWRLAVADVMLDIERDPGGIDPEYLQNRLQSATVALEKTVEVLINKESSSNLNTADYENMYRLLGAYRGLAEGVLGYTGRAAFIDWHALRESRF